MKKYFAIPALALVLGACSQSKPAEDAAKDAPAPAAQKAEPVKAAEPAPAPVAPADEAKQIFSTRCQACHGENGKGDGPTGKNLKPQPRDFTNAEFQKNTTDETIKTAILKGGAAVGKSPLMVPNPDLAAKPLVVDELVKIVRSFGNK